MDSLWYTRHAASCPNYGQFRMRVLTEPNSQPKIFKSLGKGVYSAVLHLAPADRSGHEVCPFRSAGCTQACLNLSGQALIAVQHEAKERGISVEDAARDFSQETVIQRARVGRTERFFEAEQGRRKGRNPTTRELAPCEASRPQQGEAWSFWQDLVRDIESVRTTALAKGMQPAVRLNGTSDLPWEAYPVCIDGTTYPNVMAAFPDVAFYDYSKGDTRVERALTSSSWPKNYDLTYSLSERPSDWPKAEHILDEGGKVAVVFRGHLPSEGGCPTTEDTIGCWRGYPVVDATKHDARFLDPPGTISGLVALGMGKNDISGFVHHPDADALPEEVDPDEELEGAARTRVSSWLRPRSRDDRRAGRMARTDNRSSSGYTVPSLYGGGAEGPRRTLQRRWDERYAGRR
jgi:hypothetical protein